MIPDSKQPKLLAIETSAEACSVSVLVDGRIHSFDEHAPMRHAELLLPAVRSLLEQAGLALASLDAIAFGRGPGSFTSLRIGIGVVQGLAWGAGLPVVPVSSLAAVAQDSADRVESGSRSICVAVDARMQEVYFANFRLNDTGFVQLEGEERVCEPGRVHALSGQSFIAAGNGFAQFDELATLAAQASARYPDIRPRAETIGKLALEWLKSNQPLPAVMAQPFYVRNTVALKPGGD